MLFSIFAASVHPNILHETFWKKKKTPATAAAGNAALLWNHYTFSTTMTSNTICHCF